MREVEGEPQRGKRLRRGKRPRPQSLVVDEDIRAIEAGAAPQGNGVPGRNAARRTVFRTSQRLASDYKLAIARTSLAKRRKRPPQRHARTQGAALEALLEKARSIETSAAALCAGIYRVEMPSQRRAWHGSTWSVGGVEEEVWALFRSGRHPHRGMQAIYDSGERRIDIKVVERLGLFKEASHDPGYYAADPSVMSSNNEADRVEKRLQRQLAMHERRFFAARARAILSAWRRQRLTPAFGVLREHAVALALQGRSAGAMQIQRVYRGHMVRQRILRDRDARAQTLLACLFRQMQARRQCAKRRAEKIRDDAALVIQCVFRQHNARGRLRDAKQIRRIDDAAFTIQGAWKNYMAYGVARQVALARRQQRAACRVTNFMRMVAAKGRLAFLRTERAALKVQTRWRGHRGQLLAHLRRVQREERHKAATRVQSVVRGRQARQLAKRLRCARDERCALRIQARWRAKHAQLGYFLIRKERTRCAKIIQRFYKAFAVQIAVRNRRRDAAAKCIQRTYRAMKRRIYCAARSIQRAWRYYKWFTARKRAAVRIQTFARCVLLRAAFAEQRAAAMVVQRAFRAHAARNMLQALRARRERLRGMPLCDECSDEVCGVYCRACQGKFCKACMRMVHSVLRDHEKAHLESAQGVIFAVDWTRDHIAAAVRVQRAWRRRVLRILDLAEKYKLSRRQNALMMAGMRWRLRVKRGRKAKMIQAVVRGYQGRKRAAQRKDAAIRAQAIARRFLCRLAYLRVQRACIRIQAQYRGFQRRKRYLEQREAAIKIQSVLRAWDERLWFIEQRQAAIRIQAAVRQRMAASRFRAQKRAALRIQAVVRGYQQRSHLRREHHAATRIQTVMRCVMTAYAFQRKRAAVVRVQTATRGHLVREKMRTQKGQMAAVFEGERRGRHRCAGRIQRVFRRFKARERAALRIQAAFRRNQGAYTAFLVRVARATVREGDAVDDLACVWTEHWDSWNEVTYYYNNDTLETVFAKPRAYADAEAERDARRSMMHEEALMRKVMLHEREQAKIQRKMEEWTVHVDAESGAKYYKNDYLGESTWERPEVLGPDPDEPVWKTFLHPALNRPFYVHRDTQETIWERPIEELGYEYTEYWDFEAGQPYWVSAVTGEWTYERPEELVLEQDKARDAAPISDAARQDALEDDAHREWYEAFDEESGKPYYYCWNKFTKTTEQIVWDKPDALKNAHDVWDEYYSTADQASYYVHKETGESTWKKPW